MIDQFIIDGNVGGYYDESGRFIVCEEYGSDADFDRYAVEVQNGDGFYNEDGYFVAYSDVV